MSDTSQGPGWWQASDGKWYPPESPEAPKTTNTLVVVLVVIGVLIVLGVGGCVALFVVADNAVEETFAQLEEDFDQIDQNNAEVVGSNDPGNAGTREGPLAMGTEVDLANGWRVTINSADLRADAAVAAANDFNDPPAEGNRYVVANITAAYDGNDEGAAESPAISLSVFGSEGVEHNSFDSFATPPDPRFDSIGELLPGSAASGNLVFEVGDTETDLTVRIQPLFSFDSSEAWFSLGG